MEELILRGFPQYVNNHIGFSAPPNTHITYGALQRSKVLVCQFCRILASPMIVWVCQELMAIYNPLVNGHPAALNQLLVVPSKRALSLRQEIVNLRGSDSALSSSGRGSNRVQS